MSLQEVLRPAFYDRDPRQVAVDLLGCILVHETSEGVASGIIVETEAYRPEDPACHAYKGPTMRNRNIFGRPGIAYVYLTYGVHRLLNAVCEGEEVGSAVLVRALRPLEGLETMRERRKRDINLCNGPGRLTQALNIELTLDGKELTEPPLYIKRGNVPEGEIIATTRIGISRGTELPWRYLVRGETDVSVPPRTITERGFERSDLVP
ncbi:MAG TPA: DNA-3-methyladenine glycosylase [Rubrobacteraceae bacterium]|nr:DNA-3-methyladenine glycosylase [Rubrobacteraceae bacterium]